MFHAVPNIGIAGCVWHQSRVGHNERVVETKCAVISGVDLEAARHRLLSVYLHFSLHEWRTIYLDRQAFTCSFVRVVFWIVESKSLLDEIKLDHEAADEVITEYAAEGSLHAGELFDERNRNHRLVHQFYARQSEGHSFCKLHFRTATRSARCNLAG